MRPPQETPDSSSVVAPTASTASGAQAARLLVGLARVFAVVPLYPADHTRSREVGARFLADLRAAWPTASALVVELGRTDLRIQGQSVALDLPQIRKIQQDLAALGVARVEIDATATPEEIHRFASTILDARRVIGAAQGFRQLELGELPASTRVLQRAFGRRTGESASGDRVLEAVESVLEGMEHLDPEAQALLRSTLEKMFGGVVETLGATYGQRASGQQFARSLEDVLDLGVHALRHALDAVSSAGGDPTQIQSLFAATEKALALAEDRGSVEVLLSVLAESERETPSEPAPIGIDPTQYELSLAELRVRIVDYGGDSAPCTQLERGDGREELSILLHVLLQETSDVVRESITARLRGWFSTPASEIESSYLISAVRELAARPDPAATDLALPVVLRARRGTADGGGPASIWLALLAKASPVQAVAFWPHLVNDLLLGLPGAGPAARRDLLRWTARVTDADRPRLLERLLRLDAVRTHAFAPDLFDPPPPELFPVFAALLTREGSRLGELLLQGLRRHPPKWAGAEVLFTFSSVTPACRGFLFALLREGATRDASPALVEQARRTIVSAIRATPRTEVDAEWIPRAIAALGILCRAEDRALLNELRRGFRLWPWRRWPESCRKAAAEALERGAAGVDASSETNDA